MSKKYENFKKMKTRTTIKEIAEILEVSISTVSKALNNSNEISKSTKKRIKEMALIYEYTPNGVARALKTQRTKTIAIVLPKFSSPFYAKMLEGIEVEARRNGYKLMVFQSGTSILEHDDINKIIDGSIDGLVILTEKQLNSKLKKQLKDIKSSGFPIVESGEYVNNTDIFGCNNMGKSVCKDIIDYLKQ